jgi:hypothetical protein
MLLIHNLPDTKLQELYDDIQNSKIYSLAGYVNTQKISDCKKTQYLGSMKDLRKILEKNKCDEILYIDSGFSKKELFEIWELCKIYGVRYRYITNSFDITQTNTTLSLINRTPVIEIKNTPLENWGRVIKRTTDIMGSIIGIILVSPLMILVAILIKLEDPSGPVIYKNRRIGQE